MDSRPMYWKGTDGRQTKSMKRVGTWCETVVFVRSLENGLSLALGSGI